VDIYGGVQRGYFKANKQILWENPLSGAMSLLTKTEIHWRVFFNVLVDLLANRIFKACNLLCVKCIVHTTLSNENNSQKKNEI
jgi:hypothetical protein